MKPAVRRWAIAALVGAGVALATIDFAKQDRPPPAAQLIVKEKTADLAAQLHRAPLPGEIRGQPFGALERAPRRPALASAAAEAPLPQFPFRFAGHLKERGGAVSLYLARGNDIFPIRAGDLLDGFRIDALHDDRIDVTFVAGGQRLSMPLSSLAGAGDGAAALSAQSAVAEGRNPGAAAAALLSEAQPAAPAGPMAGVLGESAPTYGSMSTDAAPFRSPRLGVGPASSERLGTETASSKKLGL
jgi:hypothetical protein